MEGIGRLWKLSRTTRYLKNFQFSSKTTTLASLERSENSTRSKTNYNIREGKVRSARDAHGEGDVGATSYPSTRNLRCACWLPCRSTNTCKVTFRTRQSQTGAKLTLRLSFFLRGALLQSLPAGMASTTYKGSPTGITWLDFLTLSRGLPPPSDVCRTGPGKWCLPCPLGIACPFGIVVFSSSERRITISTSSGSRSDDVGMVMQLSDMIR